jgi:inositol-phosphate phosphatase/L-galactose 1-phosphate phosphatase/histidinol-phosphatase
MGFIQYGPGPVTIADREAEEAMVSVILKSFPTHAM